MFKQHLFLYIIYDTNLPCSISFYRFCMLVASLVVPVVDIASLVDYMVSVYQLLMHYLRCAFFSYGFIWPCPVDLAKLWSS